MAGTDADLLVDGLTGFLRTIEEHRPHVVAGDDPEALHDLRVGVRRTRSGLKNTKRVIPGEARKKFLHEFSWLQEVTGPARDYEVWMASLDDGDPLRLVLAGYNDQARREADAAVASERTEVLFDRWSRELDDAHRDESYDARARIEHKHGRLLEAAQEVTVDVPADRLHRLRKRGKELRYLLELFPSDERKPLRKALKRLQNLLGAVQDAEVQRAWLVAHVDEIGPIDVRLKELEARDAVARAAAIERLSYVTVIPLP